MARGTDFGGVHSFRDLNLIQQLVEESPAVPKLNLIDIPGADGSKDLTTQPSGRVVYSDRVIVWTFALYPGDNWHAKQRQVSNALNGRRCKITLDENPDYYYDGRLTVKEYKRDSVLRQITVEAVCAPYMLAQFETTLSQSINTTEKAILVVNEFKPVVPTITVTKQTVIEWLGNTFTLTAGTHQILDIEFPPNTIELLYAKTTSGTGTIKIVYQEGSL